MKKLLAAVLVVGAGACAAQVGVGPQPAPAAPAIPAPRDIAFNGAMTLQVDATDSVHKIFRVRQTIPVQGKHMVLLYPQWETASHSATQTLTGFAGLQIADAKGRRLDWRRDATNPYAFHVDIPQGVRELNVAFQFLSPATGAILINRDMLTLPWNKMLVYPAGWFVRDIPVRAALKLPVGFQFATSLDTAAVQDQLVSFQQTSLEDLVDAPVYAGRYFKRIELTPNVPNPVRLNLVGDTPAALDIPPELLTKYRAVAGALPKLFASRHYRHYDLLLSLSDLLPSGGGLEHAASSENNLPADFFSNPAAQAPLADLIVHEYAHSWNGRFRQPADLWSPNLNLPVRGSLLWVYEGQTEFWGRIVAAQLGLRTQQQSLDALALDAAGYATRAGRQWKSLQDSTIDPLYMPGRAVQWRDWQRREDYYGEGVLLWLDVDMLLRERTADKKSLADFAAAFFGVGGDAVATRTYTFDDICQALNRLAPYDWAGYFRSRLDAHDDSHVLDGLARAGYRLVYTDQPSEYFTQSEAFNVGGMDLANSLGLIVAKKGMVKSVAWEGPAFRAGIPIGAKLTTVAGQPYTDELLKQAIKTVAVDHQPIALGFEAEGQTQTVSIAYYGSLRYPKLERIPGSADKLLPLLTGKTES